MKRYLLASLILIAAIALAGPATADNFPHQTH